MRRDLDMSLTFNSSANLSGIKTPDSHPLPIPNYHTKHHRTICP